MFLVFLLMTALFIYMIVTKKVLITLLFVLALAIGLIVSGYQLLDKGVLSYSEFCALELLALVVMGVYAWITDIALTDKNIGK